METAIDPARARARRQKDAQRSGIDGARTGPGWDRGEGVWAIRVWAGRERCVVGRVWRWPRRSSRAAAVAAATAAGTKKAERAAESSRTAAAPTPERRRCSAMVDAGRLNRTTLSKPTLAR